MSYIWPGAPRCDDCGLPPRDAPVVAEGSYVHRSAFGEAPSFHKFDLCFPCARDHRRVSRATNPRALQLGERTTHVRLVWLTTTVDGFVPVK